MTRLRDKLLVLFAAATLLPLAVTLYASWELIHQSLAAAPLRELAQSNEALATTARTLYQQSQRILREQAKQSLPERLPQVELGPGERERFVPSGETLLMVRPEGAYRLRVPGVNFGQLQAQVAGAHALLAAHQEHDLKRGFLATLLLVAGGIWVAALGLLWWLTRRTLAPLEALTRAMRDYGAGRPARLQPCGRDEVAQAVASFQEMTEQLARGRERMLYVTRLESWQGLARKMAHEVKNSLTPIRLTVEEMVARAHPQDRAFLDQAGQIVTEEVQALERRVRAFTELASEPPLLLESLQLEAIVAERVEFHRKAHPRVEFRVVAGEAPTWVVADADLLRGIVTNLIENAAAVSSEIELTIEAAGLRIEDNGPGLSPLARESLFQPTISFKPGGMGLGLSIARRSAVAMGGDLEAANGRLPGAAFRLRLTPGEKPCPNESSSLTTKRTLAARYA